MINFLFVVLNLVMANVVDYPLLQGFHCFAAGICFVGTLEDVFGG